MTKTCAILMLLLVALTAPSPSGVPDAKLIFAYTEHDCAKNLDQVQVMARTLPRAEPTSSGVEPVTSDRSTLSLPAGVYWITIDTYACVARFVVAAFAGTTRIVPVSLQRPPVSDGHEDPYLVPADFVMVDLPADSMSISAAMNDGRALDTEVQARKAFINYVPAGRFTISVVLANAVESNELTSRGDWGLHTVNLMCATRNCTQSAQWTEAPGSYNYYQKRGNVEAMNAAFDAAIADWQSAAQLASDPRPGCTGEFQRVQIRAAMDAKAEVASGHLTKAQAAAWFERRESALWVPDKCNGP